MNQLISSRIRFLYLFSMLSLLYVHGFTLKSQLDSPSDLIFEKMDFTSFFEMLLVNGLLRFRIPLLMLMSGFLMAKSACNSHSCLVKNRIRSLVIPFVLISMMSIMLVYILEESIYYNSSKALWGTRVDQFGPKDLLNRIFINPFAYQLWYIKWIFLFTLLYPVLRFLNSRFPLIFLTALFFIWVFTEHSQFFHHARFAFFFALGMLIYDKKWNILEPPKWFSTRKFALLFVVVGFVKTYLSFRGYHMMGPQSMLVTRILFDLNVLVGIILAWFGFDPIIARVENRKWYDRATGHGFFIYAFHAPLINILNQPLLQLTDGFFENRLLVFLFLPPFVLSICILFHGLVKNLLPGFYQILTGSRVKGSNVPLLLSKEPEFSNTFFRINQELSNRYALFSNQHLTI